MTAALASLALAALLAAQGRHRHAPAALLLRLLGVSALAALALLPPAPPAGALERARGVALVADSSASMAIDGRTTEAQRLAERLGTGVSAVYLAGEGEPSLANIDALSAHWPTASRNSRVIPAIARALAGEPPPAALVLITDGELEEGPDALSALPTRCPPVHAVVVGRRPTPDVSLGVARADAIVFAGSPTQVTARVRGVGLPRPLALRVSAADTRGVPLANTRVELPAGTSEREISLEVALANSGPKRLRLSASEPEGDALPGNAWADLALSVARDRLRVLLLAGRPSFDLRALRMALRAHQNLDLVSFYVLRTDDDLTVASNDELSLIPFPTDELFREHLHSFDVVFMHDLDPEPYGLDAHMPALARYVAQGGALAVIGATALAAPAYRSGALAALLPIVPGSSPPDPTPFIAEPSPVAGAHPLSRALIDAPLTLAGAARIASLAPDTTVLLTHPVLGLESGNGHSPLLAVRRVGAGRVMVLATDSIWRLGFPALASGGDPERLAGFWDRALAWLAGESGGTLAVQVERRTVRVSGGRAGESVDLDLEARDGHHVRTRIVLDSEGYGVLQTEMDLSSARVRSPTSGEQGVVFNAGPDDGDERAGVGRSEALLRALIARCGGEIVYGAGELPVVHQVERAVVLRRAARPRLALALGLVALVALGTEWLLRRSQGAR